MTVIKALYKKMMDDLKDAEMLLDWSVQIKEQNPDVAKYFIEASKTRIESGYPTSRKHFEMVCTKDDKSMQMWDAVMDNLDDWHDNLCSRLHKM